MGDDRTGSAATGGRRELLPTTRTALQAMVIARWLNWLWVVGIIIFDGGALRHPSVAWGAATVAAGLTIYSTVEVGRRPHVLVGPAFVGSEVALVIGLSIADGYVFEPGHVFGTTQSLAAQWPLLAMATVGFAAGPRVAAACGVLIGPAEWLGAVANGVRDWDARKVVSLVATSVFFAACGAVFGWLARSLQRAEAEIADRRARDEVARVLHDTVLQTLALIERRSGAVDPQLAVAARQADRDLRAFLFGAASRSGDDLESRLRGEIERLTANPDTVTTVSVLDDGCTLDEHGQTLLARATAEAVANAYQHAGAATVTVFAETDDDGDVFVSIRDDGVGFDPHRERSGHGIDESIIARVASIGGEARVESRPGHGTEVLLWSRSDRVPATDGTDDR